jgi:hypothetical protein
MCRMLLPYIGSRLPVEIDKGMALPQNLTRLRKCPRQLAFSEADLRLLINKDARHLRIDLRAFSGGQLSTGRRGKIGAIARLLEKCQVPITSELADRCHECDGDGTLIPVDAGDAGRRSRRKLAGAPFLERFDLLRRPPAPAFCLQLLHGPIAHGAGVGRCGIVSRTISAFVVQPPFALKQGRNIGRYRLLCSRRRHNRERQRYGQGPYRGRDSQLAHHFSMSCYTELGDFCQYTGERLPVCPLYSCSFRASCS